MESLVTRGCFFLFNPFFLKTPWHRACCSRYISLALKGLNLGQQWSCHPCLCQTISTVSLWDIAQIQMRYSPEKLKQHLFHKLMFNSQKVQERFFFHQFHCQSVFFYKQLNYSFISEMISSKQVSKTFFCVCGHFQLHFRQNQLGKQVSKTLFFCRPFF